MKDFFLIKVLKAILILTALLAFPWNAAAADALCDAAAVERFCAAFMRQNVGTGGVPGAAVAIVKGGKVIFTGGYGYADIAAKVPFTVNTRFCAASMTKVLTSMAALKLCVERKLTLAGAIGEKGTGLRIKAASGFTFCLRDLLTHTAGFDPAVKPGLLRPADVPAPGLKEFLAMNAPSIVNRPGEVFEYSNYSLALAGLLVENASGVRYEEYVKNNILDVLNMRDSGFGPAAGPAPCASSYGRFGSVLRPFGVMAHNMPPASGLYTTVSDMANLIVMLQNGGIFNGKTALDAESYKAMTERSVVFNKKSGIGALDSFPKLTGMAIGLRTAALKKREILSHTGAIQGFSCGLYIFKKEAVSVFVVSNLAGNRFRQLFLRRFAAEFLK